MTKILNRDREAAEAVTKLLQAEGIKRSVMDFASYVEIIATAQQPLREAAESLYKAAKRCDDCVAMPCICSESYQCTGCELKGAVFTYDKAMKGSGR